MASIRALPQDIVRRFNSLLVITSPDILVKELIENSIDAGATVIEVLISPNTIDQIQVRDNGHGISLSNYDALGRQYYTNKLKTIDELAYKGGNTFGFRGEALASANTCGTVVVMTRTKEDDLANILLLAHGRGGVAETNSASGLVGTTVTVTQLFRNLPVRKQQFLKESPKTLIKIREIMLRLAIVKPFLKLILKVPGNNKAGWSFSPTKAPSTKEVVLQALGRSLASSCIDIQVSDGAFVFDAFIPSREARPLSISGKGAYISVDGRPLDPLRGTVNKMVNLFKNRLCKTLGECQRPFIQANLKCPPGSYDVNVSIFKTEVIFSDEPKVLNLFQRLLDKVYGDSSYPQQESSDSLIEKGTIPNFDKLGCVPDARYDGSPVTSRGGKQPPSQPIVIEIHDSSSSGPGSPSSDIEFLSIPDSTPPTSVIGQPPSSEIATHSDTRVVKTEKMSVQTHWEVNMVEVRDSEEVPRPLKIESIEVFVNDNTATCIQEEYRSSPSQSHRDSGLNPWTLSQQRAEIRQQKDTSNDCVSASGSDNQTQVSLDHSESRSDTSELDSHTIDLPRGNMERHGLNVGLSPPFTITQESGLSSSGLQTCSFTPRKRNVERRFEHYTQAHFVPQKRQISSPDIARPNSNPPASFTPINQTFKPPMVGSAKIPSFNSGLGLESPHQGTGSKSKTGGTLRQSQLCFDRSDISRRTGRLEQVSLLSSQTNSCGDNPPDNGLSSMSPSPPLLKPFELHDIDTSHVSDGIIVQNVSDSVMRGQEQLARADQVGRQERDLPPGLHGIHECSPLVHSRSTWSTPHAMNQGTQNLPLESVPINEQMQRVVLSVVMSMDRVKKSYDQIGRWDMYIQRGENGFSVLDGVTTKLDLWDLEDKIRAVLELWGDADMAGKFRGRVSLGNLKGKGL
ncbi:PMS1 -like protein 1 [Ceratocystis fimbriata CBS 114723]|uniref:PMS1-like protein 1 n=1 Tax=Ceratocystis fimbriata CBS 114723 TaxID=1035309 RepID=A0A2C5X963_9PEZI|nr:PMS1 -like protein 1 [Ceratocystis fimbriata CBS 114723]